MSIHLTLFLYLTGSTRRSLPSASGYRYTTFMRTSSSLSSSSSCLEPRRTSEGTEESSSGSGSGFGGAGAATVWKVQIHLKSLTGGPRLIWHPSSSGCSSWGRTRLPLTKTPFVLYGRKRNKSRVSHGL